jgi:DNA-binding NarL/FixJ family response regulator
MSDAFIHVLICEDNPALLADYAAVLAGDPRFAVMAMARDGAEALTCLHEHRVDLLLLDLGLPDISGLDILQHMRRLQPRCEAIVVTVFCDEATVVRAIECGAHGYLLKQEASFNLIQRIDELLAGGAPITPAIARLLLQRMAPPTTASLSLIQTAQRSAQTVTQPSKPSLSERERDVLQMVAKGLSVQEVGDLLNLSSNTVKTYVRRIYGKLEVGSRQEAVYEARALGLLADDAGRSGRLRSDP